MKYTVFAIVSLATTLSISCTNTRIIHINADGSADYSYTIDMEQYLLMIASTGSEEEINQLKDTTIHAEIPILADSSDSADFEQLGAAEKKILQKGLYKIDIDYNKTVLKFGYKFKVDKVTDIVIVESLINAMRFRPLEKKLMRNENLARIYKGGDYLNENADSIDEREITISKSEDDLNENADSIPTFELEPKQSFGDVPDNTIRNYTKLVISEGKFSRKLLHQKYAKIDKKTILHSFGGIGGGGEAGLQDTTIIYLPRPAKKVTGKYAKLSNDKLSVIITENVADFFENGIDYEYLIEY